MGALSLAGLFVGVGQYAHLLALGAWPPHDTTAWWLAGIHVRDGGGVYTGTVGGYLTFVYAPPWAVLWAVLSYLPLDAAALGMLAVNGLALRYVCGSWRNAALTGWLPFVPQELATGNMDLLMAAVIYSAARQTQGSGGFVALFAFAKFSPALMLWRAPRGRWVEAMAGAVLALLLTLLWLHLWPEWIANMAASITSPAIQSLPILPRLPLVAVLLFVRRPWARPLACALATPAFYIHSTVLLLAPLRVWLDTHAPHRERVAHEVGGVAQRPARILVDE